MYRIAQATHEVLCFKGFSVPICFFAADRKARSHFRFELLQCLHTFSLDKFLKLCKVSSSKNCLGTLSRRNQTVTMLKPRDIALFSILRAPDDFKGVVDKKIEKEKFKMSTLSSVTRFIIKNHSVTFNRKFDCSYHHIENVGARLSFRSHAEGMDLNEELWASLPMSLSNCSADSWQ